MVPGLLHLLYQLDPTYWLYAAADWCRDELAGTHTGAVGIQFFELTARLWYWVPVGALCSALAANLLPRRRVGQLLARHRAGAVLGACLLGLASPLCTFAAIPVAARALAAGAPAAPLMAFLFSSPLMNPALFVYTVGALGMEMAVARSVTAFSIGLAAGFGTHLLLRRGHLSPRLAYPNVAGGSGAPPASAPSLARRFAGDLWFISRWFALGILLAALTATFLSPDLIRALLGPGSRWSVPVAAALGVPLYACGGGSLPVVETMMRMGMTPGAALAFFIAGPATKVQTLATLGAVFGRRLLAWYLLVMLAGALVWGYAYPFSSSPPPIPGLF